MCKLYFEDYLYIIVKSLIMSLIVCFIMFMMFNLIEFNFSVASSICKVTGIPSDLSLTTMSAGFENNIIIVMFSFEILFFLVIIRNSHPLFLQILGFSGPVAAVGGA